MTLKINYTAADPPNTPPAFEVAPLPFLDITVNQNETETLEDYTYTSTVPVDL